MILPCWIVHQPQDGGRIASNSEGQNLMFRDELTALGVMIGAGLVGQGYVVQRLSDSQGFRAATLEDGQDACWYEGGEWDT